jgi:hypothetical protein
VFARSLNRARALRASYRDRRGTARTALSSRNLPPADARRRVPTAGSVSTRAGSRDDQPPEVLPRTIFCDVIGSRDRFQIGLDCRPLTAPAPKLDSRNVRPEPDERATVERGFRLDAGMSGLQFKARECPAGEPSAPAISLRVTRKWGSRTRWHTLSFLPRSFEREVGRFRRHKACRMNGLRSCESCFRAIRNGTNPL